MELFMNKNSPSPHLTKYFLKNKNYISPSAIWQLKFENNTWKISFYLWIFKQKLKIENFTFSIFNFQIKFEILKNFGFKLKTKWHFWCMDSRIFQFIHGDIILISSSNSMFQCVRIYWNQQVSDLILALRIWMKPEKPLHHAPSAKR